MQRREMPGNKADGAKMACSCEGLVPEGNLVIVERCEDKADAQQATRLKAARHFPQISKHSRRHCGAGEEVKYIVPIFLPTLIPQYCHSALKKKMILVE